MSSKVWNGYQVIGRGANRVCVIAPDDPNYCLKFDLAMSARKFKGINHLFAYFLSRCSLRRSENQLELLAYQKLQKRLGRQPNERVAACTKLESVDGMSCLRCQRVLAAEGSAPSLNALMTSQVRRYSAEQLCAAIDDYVAWLIKFDIPLFDLNPGNFVVVDNGKKLSLVCVDIKSTVRSKELVPVSYWFKRLMHRKILRRATRLKENISRQLVIK